MKKIIFLGLTVCIPLFLSCGNSYRDAKPAVVFRGELTRQGREDTVGVREFHGVKWKFQTGSAVWSSPVLTDGVVYFGSNDMSFYALEARSGREKWRFKTGGNVRSSAAAAYGMVYFDSYDGYLYALE